MRLAKNYGDFMTTDVISAAEAWRAVEWLKLDIHYNRKAQKWCASFCEGTIEDCLTVKLGWGDTPLEAVGDLLARIGEAATVRAESANA